MQNTTLTEIEALGLNSQFNFADGHAYHDLSRQQQLIVQNLSSIWSDANDRSIKEAEQLYKHAFYQLAESPSLQHYDFFKICPTASNSIDLVSAWLAAKSYSTTLLEPTFDNLYLLLKRRGVKVAALDESLLHENDIETVLTSCNTDALFLVNPNNPTGRVLTKQQFITIVNYCVSHQKILLLDNTFRFFVAADYDQYEILIESGVQFIAIEDTGKVWPTQDMKASIVFYSQNLAKEFETIYEEIYLCLSNFVLGVLTEFLKQAKTLTLEKTVWSEVKKRREHFRQCIENSILAIDPIAMHSTLSIEWAAITDRTIDDNTLMNFFQQRNLVLLPGRHFYWSKTKSKFHNVRFSLLKPEQHFCKALQALNSGLQLLENKRRNQVNELHLSYGT